MKPFNLEQALAGEPLKDLHNGEKCWFIGESKLTDGYIFQNEEGECFAVTKNVEDIQKDYAMWEEPCPRVQLDLPCPLKKPQEGMWYLYPRYVIKSSYSLDIHDDWVSANKTTLENGFYFATQEDVQEWLNALRSARK